jgi:hypothetical protein
LVRELYEAENQGKAEPSGSQDMIGLIYPGINRLDYDFAANGGVFPSHIESLNNARVARWLERVLHVLPVEPRPEGYNPLGEKHLDPEVDRAPRPTGKDCFDAIRRMDIEALGASMNDCMTVLGKTPAARCPASAIKAGSQGHSARVPAALSRSDVFRVRRRLPFHRVPRTGAGGVSSCHSARAVMSPTRDRSLSSGGFDDIRSRHLRFLEEAASLGELTVLLWPDQTVRELTGQPPKFPEAERLYFLNAVRYVSRVIPVTGAVNPNELPDLGISSEMWVDGEGPGNEARKAFCRRRVWSIAF